MEITYQGLRISLPIEGLIQVEDFTLNAAFNCHASVSMLILAEEESLEASIQGLADGAAIEICEEETLFVGKITKAELVRRQGLCLLAVTAVSYTMDWELAPVSQSFLNLDATYGQVMDKVLENQPGAEIMDCVTQGAVIPDFLLQYEESDWDFLKRLASHFHTFLVPDCRAGHGRAYFGIPAYTEETVLEAGQYQEIKHMDQYYHAGQKAGLLPQEHISWEIRTGRTLSLAQRVRFHGIRTLVTAISWYTENGALVRSYELGREKGTISPVLKNPNIYGMSIPATVKERSGNCIRVHFHIDPEYDTSPNVKYFTYAIESSFIYCMPEVGSQVHIYFPGDDEKDAVAVHAIRTESAGGASGTSGSGSSSGKSYAQNPDNKSFSNVNGAELLMTPSGASVSADSDQNTCVQLDTNGNAKITGKNVIICADKNLSLGEPSSEDGEAVSCVYLEAETINLQIGEEDSKAKIELTEEAKIIAAFIKLDASDTTPAERPAEELKKELTANDAETRGMINGGVSSQLVNKYEEGKQKVLKGFATILKVAVTITVLVAFTVATGGWGAAASGPMLASYGLGLGMTTSSIAEIQEGTQDIEKSMSGDLSESHNFLRDDWIAPIVGEENKYVVYEFAKAANEIAFGIVTGKALGNAFDAAKAAGKIGKFACGSQELKNLKTAIQVGGNVGNGLLNQIATTGTIDPWGLAVDMGIGVIQGQIGSSVTDSITKKLGVASDIGKIAIGTGVDTAMDGLVSHMTGQEFNVWESLAQNAFANTLTTMISDPVDAATGSYTLHTTDFILAGIPEALKIERTYRSACREISVMGKGWQFPYASRLYRDTAVNGRVHLSTITGHSVCFEQEKGSWVNKSRGTARFMLKTLEEQGIHVLTDVIGHTLCVYDREGLLSYVEYPNRQRLSFAYTAEGLSEIKTSLGNILKVESRNGRILQIVDEIGRRTQYRYEDELLTDVVHMDEGITHYGYDSNGYITSVTDQNGIRYLENAYDEQGRITKQTFESGVYQKFSYDNRHRRNTITYSENGKMEVYEYNKELLMERILYEDGTCIAYAYSEDNLRTKETGRTGAETHWEYDAYGRLVRETMPDGYEKHYAYDENQDLVRVWDTDDRETVYVYDRNHNLLCTREKISEEQWKETHCQYDEKGRQISSEDALGNVTIQQYEKNGAHPVRIVTSKGEETVYGYDKVGRRMSISNPYGTVELSYNSRNFVTRRIDGEGYESHWFYDRMGNLTSYYPARQWKEQEGGYEYRYDFLERLEEIISPLKEHQRVFRNIDGDIVRSVHPVSYETAGENGAGTHYDYDKDGNCIRIHYPDGGTERRFYDAEGNMQKQVLPEAYDQETDGGKGFAYGYDSAGRLTSVRDPEGCLLKQYEYNGHGQVLRETDGEGKETLYRYNGLGLKSREQTSIRREGEVTYYRVISYRYDRQGNKVEEAYGKQEVTRDGEPSGWHKIHFAYDRNNHLVEVKDDFGARMRYDYDCLGNPVLEERVIEEGVIQRIRYVYNKNGWRIQKTEEIQGNGPVRTAATRYGYDENGNLNWIKTPKGFEIRRKYDADDRLIEERVLDKRNGIDRRTSYTYDVAGNLLSVTVKGTEKGEELRSSYQYDLKDRLTHRIGQNQAVTRYLYDQNDQLIKEITPYGYDKESDSGAGTSYSYDSRGNRIRVVNGLGQTVEERVYNLQNRPVIFKDGYGNQTAFAYTPDGQLKEALREPGRGNAARSSGKGNKVLQSYEYNARGQITGITDGNGEKIEYSLDSWGRITGIGFSDGVSEGYEYTPAGQVSRAVDGNGNSIRYRYNSLGKVCERIDQSGYKETFQYDEEGNLSLHTDRDGKQVTRTYNVFGSLVYEKATDENGENPVITTCRYDSLGRLTHAVCDGHSYEYLYNEDGQLKEKRSGGRRLVSYTYDEAGQVMELTDPAGVTTCYEYDLLGRTSRIYSREGMEVKYTYDCLDRPECITYGNGLETAYRYDTDSRVTYLETRHGEEVLLSFQYEYDGNGNRISKTGIQPGIAGTDYATAGSCALDVSYQYDIRGQLLEEKQNEEVFRYTYDAAGNRIKKEDGEGITTYCYNEKNQLVSEEGLRGRNTFTYSRQGSILKKESRTGESRFFYNNKNQQIRVELEDGQVQENCYDAEGLRHELKENGKLLKFVYHNGKLLHERYEGGDKEESSYHLGLGIEAVRRNQSIHYYHRDEQLSTAFMTAQNGEVQNQYRYDAFGNLLESEEKLFNRIRYTGQQYDRATEQYYLRARYYTPALGRFLQEDVYQGDGLNLYAYCGNNPVVYYDPSGYKQDENWLEIFSEMSYEDKLEALYERRDEYFQTKKDNGKLKYSDAELLPGELEAVLYSVKKKKGDNISPHHMPSAESISNDGISKKDGACTNTMGGTHENTFTYGLNSGTRGYDKALYEALSYEDRLEFDHYDLLCNYAETRKNVDIDLVEAKLQEQHELAMKVKETSEKEKKEEVKQEKC